MGLVSNIVDASDLPVVTVADAVRGGVVERVSYKAASVVASESCCVRITVADLQIRCRYLVHAYDATNRFACSGSTCDKVACVVTVVANYGS